MEKRLYKTTQGAMLAGVCAGLAEYLSVDVTLVRLAFVIFSLMGGAGLLGYLIAAIIMPSKWQVVGDHRPQERTEPTFRQQTETWTEQPTDSQAEHTTTERQDFRPKSQTVIEGSGEGQRLFALILIAVGTYMLVNRFFNFNYLVRFWLRDWWPLLPLLLGVVLLISSFGRQKRM